MWLGGRVAGCSGLFTLCLVTVGVEGYMQHACSCELHATPDFSACDASTQAARDAALSWEGKKGELYQLKQGDYNGHNIAAMAVDSKTGRIIGCQWNHCHLMKSTAAHAEERLIDRLFATADLCGLDHSVKYNKVGCLGCLGCLSCLVVSPLCPVGLCGWCRFGGVGCASLPCDRMNGSDQFLKDVVVYTSLEPCCAW